MDKNSHTPAKKIDVHGARRLIFMLAVSSTLGFWVVASKASQISTALVKDAPQTAGALPPLQTENQFILDLPPLPTLVPTLESFAAGMSQSLATVQNPVTVVKSSLPITGKILMGGAKPSSGGSLTITTTGSSK
jgi:hypothetical protein